MGLADFFREQAAEIGKRATGSSTGVNLGAAVDRFVGVLPKELGDLYKNAGVTWKNLTDTVGKLSNPLEAIKKIEEEAKKLTGADGKALNIKERADVMAAKLAEVSGMDIEAAKKAVKAYQDNPKITPEAFAGKLGEIGGGAVDWVKNTFKGVTDRVIPAQVSPRPSGREQNNGFQQFMAGLVAGATGLGKEALSEIKKIGEKPTAEDIAKLVESGKLTSKQAQDMINAGMVKLPDPSTIGTQKPAPVETRTPTPVTQAVAPQAVTPAAAVEPIVVVAPVAAPVVTTAPLESSVAATTPATASASGGVYTYAGGPNDTQMDGVTPSYAAAAGQASTAFGRAVSGTPGLDQSLLHPAPNENRFDPETYQKARKIIQDLSPA